MQPLLLHTFSCVCVCVCVCVLSVAPGVAAVTTETVVGVAGRRVTLPCRLEAAGQRGVALCWGRGQPSLFSCHDTLISSAGGHVTYRKSHRYTASSSSLSIFTSRPSDAGFYHCRVQLDGLFNDQTTSVHLIIISPRSVVSDSSDGENTRTLNAPRTTAGDVIRDVTQQTGSDVTADNTTGPMVAQVQRSVQQQINTLQNFIGNTLRVSFIVFIPALMLTAAHRLWRSVTDRSLDQSEEEEEACSSV